MKLTSAPLSESRAMYDANLREISHHIGRIGELHTAQSRPAPETYLAVTQAIRTLRESWRRHIEINQALFAGMIPERIAEENELIDRRMTTILSAAWPRSVEAGILSIRTGVLDILACICRQLEQECRAHSDAWRNGRNSTRGNSGDVELFSSRVFNVQSDPLTRAAMSFPASSSV